MYTVENPIGKAMNGMSQAGSTYGGMMKDIEPPGKPDPTAGGAAMSGMGGAAAGAQIGTMVSTGAAAGPYGAAIGAAVGIGSYFLS